MLALALRPRPLLPCVFARACPWSPPGLVSAPVVRFTIPARRDRLRGIFRRSPPKSASPFVRTPRTCRNGAESHRDPGCVVPALPGRRHPGVDLRVLAHHGLHRQAAGGVRRLLPGQGHGRGAAGRGLALAGAAGLEERRAGRGPRRRHHRRVRRPLVLAEPARPRAAAVQGARLPGEGRDLLGPPADEGPLREHRDRRDPRAAGLPRRPAPHDRLGHVHHQRHRARRRDAARPLAGRLHPCSRRIATSRSSPRT